MADVQLNQRVSTLRRRVLRDLREIFADLEELADPKDPGGLVTLASRYERERDKALERVTELERELVKRPLPGLPGSAPALIIDAAMTLRNAVYGVASSPMSSVADARLIGQVNKAVVAFDEQTKGLV